MADGDGRRAPASAAAARQPVEQEPDAPNLLDEVRARCPRVLSGIDFYAYLRDRGVHVDPRLVRLVECRFFAGLSEQETADALGLSLRTVQRDWLRARAALRRELSAST